MFCGVLHVISNRLGINLAKFPRGPIYSLGIHFATQTILACCCGEES